MAQSEKIKILFHLNQLGYGGTEKAILTFCQNLDRELFTPYLYVYNKSNVVKKQLLRLVSPLSHKLQTKFHKKHIAPWVRLKQFKAVLGESNLFIGNIDTLVNTLEAVAPDIIHFNRGNWETFYERAIARIPHSTVCIETNIFGKAPSEEYLQRLNAVYFVSQWLLDKSPWHEGKGKILFNPIKSPATENDLRAELEIPENAFVLGRISRPDLIDDLFILDVFERLQKTIQTNECYMVILAGSESIKQRAKQYTNIKFIEPTIDEVSLSLFYNSLDVLLHHRIDGETFGMNIAEAMIHGKPVVSHLSHVDNAQAELLQPKGDDIVGFVAQEHNLDEYLSYITNLYQDRVLVKRLGENAKLRANRLYHEEVVTRYLEQEYQMLINSTVDFG